MCFSRFAAIYSEHQPLIKEGHVRKNKQQHGLIRFSFAWQLFCNDLEVNRARCDREIRLWNMSGRTPPFLPGQGSLSWPPKNARERSQERQFSFSALALLTTPQKHLRIASYKLWSHSESNQARTNRKPAKITCFHVFSLAQAFFFDQQFKYRGPPPAYAHILLIAPQKHLGLAS